MFSVSGPTRFSWAMMLQLGFMAFTAAAAVLDLVFYKHTTADMETQATLSVSPGNNHFTTAESVTPEMLPNEL